MTEAMTMRERIAQGMLFTDYCEGLPDDRSRAKGYMKAFNSTGPEDLDQRMAIMNQMLGKSDGAWIEPPFYFAYGTNISLGSRTYINMCCSFIDDGAITIGNNVMFGPNVTIATVGHPIAPNLREYMYTAPVAIEDNVWIGAGAIICPGVTVGENSVIGAGSVVISDVPANVVAVGNPCRVLREINEQDQQFYYRDREITQDDLAAEAALR